MRGCQCDYLAQGILTCVHDLRKLRIYHQVGQVRIAKECLADIVQEIVHG